MKWIIEIRNYGAYLFDGTEPEARRECSDKSSWEGERGVFRSATDAESAGGKIKRTLEDDPIC